MDALDYQSPPDPMDVSPSPLLWAAAGLVVLAAVVTITRGTVTVFRASGMGLTFYLYQLGIMAAAAGIIALEIWAVLLNSQRASEALGTIFCIPAFIVIPPLFEALLGIMHVPGIHRAIPDFSTAGLLVMIGALGGFIGFAHFQWYGRLRQVPVRVEAVEQTDEPAPPDSTETPEPAA